MQHITTNTLKIDEYKQRTAPKVATSSAQTSTHSKHRIDTLISQDPDESSNDSKKLYVEYMDEKDGKNHSLSRVTINPVSLEYAVKSKRRIIIPPRARARVEARTSISGEHAPYLVEATSPGKIHVVPGIGRHKSLVVDVYNASNVPVHIERRETIGRATTIDHAAEAVNAAAISCIPETPDLTHAQREQLNRLLEKHKDLFVTENNAIGIVPFIQQEVDTGDHAPIRSKPYRVCS